VGWLRFIRCGCTQAADVRYNSHDVNANGEIKGRGILLVNLGSPDEPTEAALRRYLNEFLMDERVLDIPWLIRRFVVSAFILPRRPAKSAEAYKEVWTDEGSPLIVHTERLAAALTEEIEMPVEIGMRYGNPSIAAGLEKLMARPEIEEIFLVPLYPQYAMATFETVVVKAVEDLERLNKKREAPVSLTVQPPFYRHPLYIDSLAAAAAPAMEGGAEHVLFSYHGVPVRHLYKTGPVDRECGDMGDCCMGESEAHSTCYRHQTVGTTLAAARALGLRRGEFSIAYQSRFGPDRWLEPETESTIRSIVGEGVKDLVVLCPSFTADCLETIEEIGIRAREMFIEGGGQNFRLAPCVNEHPLWVQALKHFCLQTPKSSELPRQVRDTVCSYIPG